MKYEKYIEKNGKNILKIVANNNEYKLIDLTTNKIIANNQLEILNKIRIYLLKNWKEV